jgi:hypothetical protein
MGRPKGVENRKGHKAGESKPKEKKLAPGQKTIAFGSSATATDEVPLSTHRVSYTAAVPLPTNDR